MANNLREWVEPKTTAIVINEMQEAIAGRLARAPLDGLAKAVHEGQVVEHLAALLKAARRAGAHVFHGVYETRPDRLGTSVPTPLIELMAKLGAPPLIRGSEAVAIMHELGPEEGDFIISRTHGWHPFEGTELDSLLRDIGVKTVIAAGVSTNIGVQGIVVEALNRNYRAIVASDCVAGFPPEYAEMSLKHGVGIVARVTTAKDIAAAWGIDLDGA
ncbi:MAG TPA: cysteine hydrolase [Candidatus Binataceae bacterium]|nr:cysteine hydrolase [Candidatus Binataceae bacterium]